MFEHGEKDEKEIINPVNVKTKNTMLDESGDIDNE